MLGALSRTRDRRAKAAVAVSLSFVITLLAAGALNAPASADPDVVVSDSLNGTGNANGSATETGGKTWQAVNGTWTRSGSGTVTTTAATSTNPMLVADLGTPDVDARLASPASSGEAIYVRVQDASNWVRARLQQVHTSSTTYPTEYQHQDYYLDKEYTRTYREYEYQHYTTETQWQDQTWQEEYSKTTPQWESWWLYDVSACQASAGDVNLPANTSVSQYRLGSSSTSGCTGGKKKWNKERRDLGYVVSSQWVDGFSASGPAGYTATGNERYVNVGAPYWGTRHDLSGSTWAHQVGSRNVLAGLQWTQNTTVSAPDTMTGNTRISSTTAWWTALGKALTGYDDPCLSYASSISCSLTGATRQGSAIGNPYWNTTPCAGCPTRTSTTPVTTTTDEFKIHLEKSVDSTISDVANWAAGSSPLAGFRVTTDGPTINVYAGSGSGTFLGTWEEMDLVNESRHGCGLGGGADTYSPASSLTYCSVQAVNPVIDACVAQYNSGSGDLGAGQARRQVGSLTVVGGEGMGAAESSVSAEGERTVAIPAANDADIATKAASYETQGRSVLKDAQAAGVSSTLVRKLCKSAQQVQSSDGQLFDSICVKDTSDSVQWEGCVQRYRVKHDGDSTYDYGVDVAQASGHETRSWPWLALHAGGVTNEYRTDDVDIINVAPGADIEDVERCYPVSFGVSALGFGASLGGRVCPDSWDVTRSSISDNPERLRVEWKGETHSDREVNALSAYRVAQGHSSEYKLWINYNVS